MHRTEGTYHNGNLFTDGPPGTIVEQNWANAMQEEVCNVIESAGVTLKTASTETRDQLLTALQALFLQKTGAIGKNAIINGDFRINQRSPGIVYTSANLSGTATPGNNDDVYILDRWILLSEGADIVDVSQSTEAPTGGLFSCALDVETINKKFGIFQPIEQKNCMHMVGDTVSLSFYAKVSDITKLDNIKAVVLSWDGVADTITSDIVSAWGVEDTTPTWVANWTAEHTPSNLGVTASWVKYTIPNISIDTADTKNIGVFIWSDGFCDTLGTFLYITGIQLEPGVVSSEYEWRNITDELALCQRYYCKSYDQNVAPGSADEDGECFFATDAVALADHLVEIPAYFPVVMVGVPSIVLYSPATGLSGKVLMAAGDVVGVASKIGDNKISKISGTNGAASVSRIMAAHYTASIEL